MGHLEVSLVNQAHGRVKATQLLIPQLAGFQDWFTFDHVNGKTRLKIQQRIQNKFHVAYKEDPLFWCLWAMGNNFETDDLMKPDILFNFLKEQLTKETAEGKTRIEGRLLADLSSYATVHEILSAVRHSRPMCTNCSADEAIAKADRSGWRTMEREKNSQASYPEYLVARLRDYQQEA
jgi:hypothetical protein